MGNLNIREKLQQKAELSSLFMTSEDMERAINGHDVVLLKLECLLEFPNHPYKVEKNDDMRHLITSIEENGVLSPIIVRRIEDGKYQIISGHRRVFASRELGKTEIPAIVIECDYDDAVNLMVDSNIHRKTVYPSEMAYSLRMKYDAMKRQGKRNDLDESASNTSAKKSRTDKELAVEFGIGRTQVQRYLALSNLIPDLMVFVDEGRIKLTAAFELTCLSEYEQRTLCDLIADKKQGPTIQQAKLIKENSKNGVLSEVVMESILVSGRKQKTKTITLDWYIISKYFPEDASEEQIKTVLVKAMEDFLSEHQ